MEEIRIIWDEKELRSLALDNDKVIGECEIELSNNAWAIVHTGVREEYGGRGIAKQLVLKVIEEARIHNKKIIPICSYANHMMMGKEEYQDVIEKR